MNPPISSSIFGSVDFGDLSKRKTRRRASGIARISGILLICLIIAVGFLSVEPWNHRTGSAESISAWETTTSYSIKIGYQSCAVYSSYIYCVGGYSGSGVTNAVYYAPISSSGVGTWSSTTSYPTDIYGQSCTVYSGYIYCVGGFNGQPAAVNAVYYASISSSGVGTWSSTTSYPTIILYESCAANSGYIYCVGGSNSTSTAASTVYYAPISSSGVGTWSSTTSYPTGIDDQSCAVQSNLSVIYCVGGYSGSGVTNAVYYAPISSSGVGTWSSTTSYSTGIVSLSCAVPSGYIYCVGGDTVSGETNAVYYAGVIALTTSTTSSSSSPSSTTSSSSASSSSMSLTTTSTTSSSTSSHVVPSGNPFLLPAVIVVVGVVAVAGLMFLRRPKPSTVVVGPG